MRVSYLWLKSLLNFPHSPQELAYLLTMVGLEVESLDCVGPELEGISIGKVLEVNAHPNADKLTLCKVDLGDSITEVVCGAPNVAPGQRVPFVGVGTALPNGMLVEAKSIRGVRSEGMICSEIELGLGDDADGIMVLDPDARVGQHLRDYLGPQDWSLEIEVTINRPDCLSHVGVAREIAAATGKSFSPPEYIVKESNPSIEELTLITIDDPILCPRYSARVIQDVKIGPSPLWMRQRLEAVGLRSINNVVDVSNYVMLEMGHPMHAFDFDLLEGKRIEVKCATRGEKFTTLDEIDRELDEKMLLICDGNRGVALAGVMGGLNSEIEANTKNLLLESAYFDPINTRRTSKLLSLSTDSSRRFERGTDPNATVRALDMAASLIVEYAGGVVASGVADVYPHTIEFRKVELRPDRVCSILGIEIPKEEMRDHLINLGCEVDGEGPYGVTVPTSRNDLEREIDLIEDIARLHGYNKIPAADKANVSLEISTSSSEAFQDYLVEVLVKLGFIQAVTTPLISAENSKLPGYPEVVKVRNPGSEDMAGLRNGLLPGLLRVASHNVNRGMSDLRIFEIGRVFAQEGEGEREWDAVAGLMLGVSEPQHWDQVKKTVGFLDIKGVVEILLQEIRLDKPRFICYNISKAERFTADLAVVQSGETEIGRFGQLHPQVVSAFELDIPIYAFEFTVPLLEESSERRQAYRPFPKFPVLQRDLAFVVDEAISAGDMLTSIRQAGGENLVSCELFDVYHGDQVGEARKSLAFRLNFQSPDRTLTDDETNRVIERIIQEIENNFNAKLRS